MVRPRPALGQQYYALCMPRFQLSTAWAKSQDGWLSEARHAVAWKEYFTHDCGTGCKGTLDLSFAGASSQMLCHKLVRFVKLARELRS